VGSSKAAARTHDPARFPQCYAFRL
jgi:hypothetical protein